MYDFDVVVRGGRMVFESDHLTHLTLKSTTQYHKETKNIREIGR
jgi:hypothetical protein